MAALVVNSPRAVQMNIFVVRAITAILYPLCVSGCCISLTGDVNMDKVLTSADFVGMVNFAFRSGPAPLPRESAADVDCSGAVTSGDIIYMVSHVFQSQQSPCDVCTLIGGGTGGCP